MENLIIPRTDETPEVNFYLDGNLSIRGVSIPENVSHFYNPIVKWIEMFGQQLPNQIILRCEIEYINTPSTRVFLDLIKKYTLSNLIKLVF